MLLLLNRFKPLIDMGIVGADLQPFVSDGDGKLTFMASAFNEGFVLLRTG